MIAVVLTVRVVILTCLSFFDTNTSIRTFNSRTNVMVNNNSNKDNKLPPSNDYEGSSKERKHEVAENDVSALADSTTNKFSDILPIALNLFKGNDVKSMKIK